MYSLCRLCPKPSARHFFLILSSSVVNNQMRVFIIWDAPVLLSDSLLGEI